MKGFIKRRLREDLTNSYVIGSANQNEYQISEGDIKNELNSLPNVIKLYRVVYVEDESQINQKQVGSHYMLNKLDLERSHYQDTHVGVGQPFLLTVKADKSLIDIKDTLEHRIKYPHEKEITLRNKGLGAKIIKVEPFISNDEDLIGTPDDIEFNF